MNAQGEFEAMPIADTLRTSNELHQVHFAHTPERSGVNELDESSDHAVAGASLDDADDADNALDHKHAESDSSVEDDDGKYDRKQDADGADEECSEAQHYEVDRIIDVARAGKKRNGPLLFQVCWTTGDVDWQPLDSFGESSLQLHAKAEEGVQEGGVEAASR